MRRALITGLSGFTGSYLATELTAAGYEVFGTSLYPQPQKKNIHRLDLCDLAAVQKVISAVSPTIVAHLAAVSFVDHSNIEEMYKTNIVGTRNLLLALSNLKKVPDAVLLASSGNVYGNSSDKPITEKSLPVPTNDYSISKLAMEQIATLWLDRLPVFIVRPFNYTGVGQSLKFIIPKIVDHFSRGAKQIELGSTDVSRDFSDVRTVAESYRKLIKLAPIGEKINICSGLSVCLNEVLDIMVDIAGYEIQVKENPAFIRKNEIKSLQGSQQLLTNLIGESQQISLRETLLWMYKTSQSSAR